MLLEARGLSRRFGGLMAVRSIDFSVDRGEVLGLIGPNGAGKTTLFNLLSGVLPPTQGNFFLDGQPLGGQPPHRICENGIARTFQIVRPFPDLTVLDNLLVGVHFGSRARSPKTRGGSADTARQTAFEVLERTGLIDKAGVPARTLTLADRKRLEIARALGTRPRLLLLDEVASGLNPSEMREALRLLVEIRETGVAMIFVEHVLKAVLGISDRVLVMDHGEKIAEAPPDTVMKDLRVTEAYLGKRAP